MRRQERRWAVGITTAPRPQPTLKRTMASLRAAGWSDFDLFDDAQRVGAWLNWLNGLRDLLDRHADADTLMMVQDDAVFCRGLRTHLDKTLWPDADVALCSPYCPTPYKRAHSGWHEERRGWYLIGAVCWVLPPNAARSLLVDLDGTAAERQIDARVGRWAITSGRSVWYHTPSLVQHTGCGNSALGDKSMNSIRRATDFIGEEATP